jgi:hypothetical protein
MMRKRSIVAREIREAIPATILFLFLFHMIGLTKAVLLGDYSIGALRVATATVGALIVAKAILIVEALPISRLFSTVRAVHILWKTLLFGAVVLLFRFLEEIIPLASKHGGLVAAVEALLGDISWPLFWVLTLWVTGGLLLYSVVSELVRVVGAKKVKEVFFGSRGR